MLKHVTRTPCIYFAKCSGSGLVKIGSSRNVQDRMKSLKAVHGEMTLLAVAEWKEGREREIHTILDRSRVEGEWFRPSRQVREFMKANATRWEPEGHKGGSDESLTGRILGTAKSQKSFTLSEGLVQWIGFHSLREHKLPSAIVERLLCRAIEAEGWDYDSDRSGDWSKDSSSDD